MLTESIFRAYDIRGIVGQSLFVEGVYQIGQALGSECLARGDQSLLVARDGRLSGPEMAQALIQGIRATGCHVIDIGQVPTPVLYFAAATHTHTRSGVMITGSHNPPDYNGFKIVLRGETLYGDQIRALYTRICQQDLTQGTGEYQTLDIRETYLQDVCTRLQLERPLKVVLDSGNGVTGELAPELFRRLGCEVIALHSEIDGRFPNHHPDPGKLENLQDLLEEVSRTQADIGLAFDGDGDRVGIVTPQGEVIYPDRLLMMFADEVLAQVPHGLILYDVKCTHRVKERVQAAGGQARMIPTGHSLVKAEMKRTQALLAGEMSGHIFFQENWYGFDDGLYAGARFLRLLAASDQDADTLISTYPQDPSTPEINVTVTEDNKFALIERLAAQGDFTGGDVTLIDGVRVDYEDAWGLCRASNTTPMLVLRFEGKTPEALARVQAHFRQQLAQLDASLTLNF
ncbi:phosphomannomutase / phosphoglucomutase [Allopseudospirillum japonicum]|uniref:phosphomannomutase n=1 Tax=Allopseudospirillum japonicum TaxID=64971 RepID=A0A1H6U0M1_9GAMM|nr:phosphomannomutase/phosphoglucomutase [Allopseudospirillum japonicum]SEI85853.1 phosphomannomutase / phosphoglucomutase [Allopseudospirillum japonicum]